MIMRSQPDFDIIIQIKYFYVYYILSIYRYIGAQYDCGWFQLQEGRFQEGNHVSIHSFQIILGQP